MTDPVEVAQQCCPDCGIGFMDFRRQGRLGCANDYGVFRPLLSKLIVRLHCTDRHVGKHPTNNWVKVSDLGPIRQLRRELGTAIAEGNYERAAELRDQLREMESANGS